VCYTAGHGRNHCANRIAVTCATADQARAALAKYVAGEKSPNLTVGRVASNSGVVMMFTGQGSQYAGMGQALYESEPVFKDSINECAALLKPHMDKGLVDVLYPKPGQSSPIDETQYTQPALFAFEYALAQLWISIGVEPQAVIGHSVGEYVAACIAGVFSLEDGLKLIAARAKLMDSVPREGSMAAVFAPESQVAAALKPHVATCGIAAVNGPNLVVISGKKATVATVLAALAKSGVKGKELNTSNAFHSCVMDPILEAFKEVASAVTYSEPQTTIVLNRTGMPATGILTADYWVDHLRNAVLFSDSVQSMVGATYKIFLEVGPNPTLIGMARRAVTDPEINWITTLSGKGNASTDFAKAVGQLYVLGAKELDLKKYDESFDRRAVILPTYAFQRLRYWHDNCDLEHEGYVKKSEAGSASAVCLEDILYDVNWVADTVADGNADLPTWLILADKSGLGDQVASLARGAGANVSVLYATAVSDPLNQDQIKAAVDVEGEVTVIDSLAIPMLCQYGELMIMYWIEEDEVLSTMTTVTKVGQRVAVHDTMVVGVMTVASCSRCAMTARATRRRSATGRSSAHCVSDNTISKPPSSSEVVGAQVLFG
jgi:acyl transferase domain-containing protein